MIVGLVADDRTIRTRQQVRRHRRLGLRPQARLRRLSLKPSRLCHLVVVVASSTHDGPEVKFSLGRKRLSASWRTLISDRLVPNDHETPTRAYRHDTWCPSFRLDDGWRLVVSVMVVIRHVWRENLMPFLRPLVAPEAPRLIVRYSWIRPQALALSSQRRRPCV